MSLPALPIPRSTPPPPIPVLQAAVGELPVQEVLYDLQLRYLIIVLREDGSNGGASTRQALLGLKPNNQQLGDAHTGGQLVGVIATAQGESVCLWVWVGGWVGVGVMVWHGMVLQLEKHAVPNTCCHICLLQHDSNRNRNRLAAPPHLPATPPLPPSLLQATASIMIFSAASLRPGQASQKIR